MGKRRPRLGNPRGWAAALGIAAVSLVGGALIARETVAGMDPFYREVIPAQWRERPAHMGPRPTEAATAIYSPIGWGEAAPPVPTRPDPALDDPALLGPEGERVSSSFREFGDPVEDEWSAEPPAPGEREVGYEFPPEITRARSSESMSEEPEPAPAPAIVPEDRDGFPQG